MDEMRLAYFQCDISLLAVIATYHHGKQSIRIFLQGTGMNNFGLKSSFFPSSKCKLMYLSVFFNFAYKLVPYY